MQHVQALEKTAVMERSETSFCQYLLSYSITSTEGRDGR